MSIRKVLGVLAAAAMAVSLCGCGEGASEYDASSIGPKLNIGITFDRPGLGFSHSSEYKGLEVDLARLIAQDLGYSPNQIVWKQVRPGSREGALTSGQVDMVLASYSITQARKQVVDFAGPYFMAGQDLLVRKDEGSIKGVDSLEDRRVCTEKGSTSSQVIRRRAPKALLQERDELGQCITALLSGDADAASSDDFVLAGLAHVKGGGQLRLVGIPFTRERYGVGVRKDQAELVSTINHALEKMMKDGSWAAAVKEAASSIGYQVDPSSRRPDRLDGSLSSEDR